MSDLVQRAREALADRPAWIVGGALRDRLLGRPTADLDLVVEADAGDAARSLARAIPGVAFPLSEAFAAWRVVARDRSGQVDVTPLDGEPLERNLAARDFTVNALAAPLGGGETIDPSGGIADLEARRLRMVSRGTFEADPLRVLRLARLACELDFGADAATLAVAREHAGGLRRVAAERVFAELKRIVVAPAALAGLSLMEDVGATAAVLPELHALRGVEQSAFHHLDVYEHTLAVLEQLIAIEADPSATLGEHAAGTSELLAQPLADDLSRGQGLRFAALLHDVAKPHTRALRPDGRVTFIGHDDVGASLSHEILTRLRASERLASYVGAITRSHLRLGFLVHERPLSRRAVHRYLRACEPVEVEVTVLSVADRLATRGEHADEAIAVHLELARELLGEALRWRAEGPPRPLLRGDQLVAELGISGPEIGTVLAALEEAQFAGEIATADEALARARDLGAS